MPRPLLVDHYIFRQLAGWYASAVGIIVFLLCIETLPRLLGQLGGVTQRVSIISRSLASLIPEYVALALPVALFLATALTYRRLALSGELEIFAASGLGNARLLRGPVAVGIVTCLLLVGLRGYIQPAGERELDAIGHAVANGQFGYALEPGVTHRLDPATRLYFARIDALSGELVNVLLVRENLTITAASATIRLAPRQLVLSLNNATAVWDPESANPHAIHLHRMRLPIPRSDTRAEHIPSARDRLDRLSLRDLWQFDRANPQPTGLTKAMANASISARFATALLCCVLPFLGFVHGVPPKRSRSAIGIGVGVVEIILFWRLSALVEDRYADMAPVAHGALVALVVVLAVALMRFQRSGLGAVEQALSRFALALNHGNTIAARLGGGENQLTLRGSRLSRNRPRLEY